MEQQEALEWGIRAMRNRSATLRMQMRDPRNINITDQFRQDLDYYSEAILVVSRMLNEREPERIVAKTYANNHGYFWLPCPFPGCGRMFGGHECGAYTVIDSERENGMTGSMTCQLHDDFAKEAFEAQCWKAGTIVEKWSSDGQFHYSGHPEEDMALVSEFRQFKASRKQCTHEDMSCPPGECEDLYPPHREDSGR